MPHLDSRSHARRVDNQPDIICLSHLRWDFVFQRPQHLLTRCARERRVFFFEEPIFDRHRRPRLARLLAATVYVDRAAFPHGTSRMTPKRMQRELLDGFICVRSIADYMLWYYTPMALSFTRPSRAARTVYDCMDELSAFKGAPPELQQPSAS